MPSKPSLLSQVHQGLLVQDDDQRNCLEWWAREEDIAEDTQQWWSWWRGEQWWCEIMWLSCDCIVTVLIVMWLYFILCDCHVTTVEPPNKGHICPFYREAVLFSEGPLSEVPLYICYWHDCHVTYWASHVTVMWLYSMYHITCRKLYPVTTRWMKKEGVDKILLETMEGK